MLYRWNLDLTAAVHSVLGLTEVILRNAMDQQLQAWNTKETSGLESWLLHEPAAPLRSLTSQKRKEAKRRAENEAQARAKDHPRAGVPVVHDDVLAQVMFGMWKDLLPNHHPEAGDTGPNRNRKTMWGQALRYAFPNANDPDGEITYWRVAHLHLLRNRVSHMEPLLHTNVAEYTQEAFALVRSINENVADWVTGISKVSQVLKQRPAA